MATFECEIQRDANNKVTVTHKPNNPGFKAFKKNEDRIRFKSSDPGMVIRYVKTSPFTDSELGVGTELPIGTIKGPFQCTIVGVHHFECGRIENGKFIPWPEGGGDTPVEDFNVRG